MVETLKFWHSITGVSTLVLQEYGQAIRYAFFLSLLPPDTVLLGMTFHRV